MTLCRDIKSVVEDIQERLKQKGIVPNPLHAEDPAVDDVEISKEKAIMLKVINELVVI